MGIPLELRGRAPRLAQVTSPPTIAGTARVGQTLTVDSLGLWDKTYLPARTEIQWQVADAPFTNWADVPGATGSSFALQAAHIDKRLRALVTVYTLDGPSNRVPTLASAIVLDNPAAPLQLVGSPPSSAIQDQAVQFDITALGGRPNSSGAKYGFALVGPWPTGSSIQLDADGDQGMVSPGVGVVGTYTGLRVRCTDSTGATADIGPFNFTVSSAGLIAKVLPGAGWSGASPAITVRRGSSSAYGYNRTSKAQWFAVPHQDITGQIVYWLVARHATSQANYNSFGSPAAGIEYVDFSVNNGPLVRVTQQFNAEKGFWGFPIRVDAADYADGVGFEMRAWVYPRNGLGVVMQGIDFWMKSGMFFNINRGGGLITPNIWVSGTGNDSTGNGTEGNPYRSIERALTAIRAANGSASTRGGNIWCKAGTYAFSSATRTDCTNRWINIQAAPGVPRTSITFTGGSGLMLQRVHLRGVQATVKVSHQNGSNDNDTLWLDSYSFNGSDILTSAPFDNVSPMFKQGIYVTDSVINTSYESVQTARYCENVLADRVGRDAFSQVQASLNCTGVRVKPPGGGHHPDVMQLLRNDDGVHQGGIHIRLTAVVELDAQGLYLSPGNNSSGPTNNTMENLFLEYWNLYLSAANFRYVYQVRVPWTHGHVWFSKFLGNSGALHTIGATITDVPAVGSQFVAGAYMGGHTVISGVGINDPGVSWAA